jgi:hypothetical protein
MPIQFRCKDIIATYTVSDRATLQVEKAGGEPTDKNERTVLNELRKAIAAYEGRDDGPPGTTE